MDDNLIVVRLMEIKVQDKVVGVYTISITMEQARELVELLQAKIVERENKMWESGENVTWTNE